MRLDQSQIQTGSYGNITRHSSGPYGLPVHKTWTRVWALFLVFLSNHRGGVNDPDNSHGKHGRRPVSQCFTTAAVSQGQRQWRPGMPSRVYNSENPSSAPKNYSTRRIMFEGRSLIASTRRIMFEGRSLIAYVKIVIQHPGEERLTLV